tara:strand:+ start:287 stop:613 length:327 start_codon:yes stop_codon:yes gene_type:complete
MHEKFSAYKTCKTRGNNGPQKRLLESFVTKHRDRKAALKFLRKTMKWHGKPDIIVTDRLRSYCAVMKVIGNASRQETGRWLNNRAENSHLPFRRKERAMHGAILWAAS